MLGQVDFSLIPVWFVDELSILYGGSSLREGSGALGGSIQLDNRAEWNGPFSLSFNQEIGSFGTLGSYGKLGMGNGRIRSDTRLFWNRSKNDYPYLNTEVIPSEKQRLGSAAYRKKGIFQQFAWRPGDMHELAFRIWYQESSRELPPLMSQEGAAREERQDDRQLRGSAEWKAYPDFGKLLVRTAYAGSGTGYYLHHDDFDYRQFDSRSREHSTYNTARLDMNAGNRTLLSFRGDYNYHRADIVNRVDNTGYEGTRNEAGISAALFQEAGKRWVLYSLIRQEYTDGKWLPVMPSLGFRFNLQGQGSILLKGNFSRNYNLPSLNDLHWIPGGNPGLKPENSLNADLSLSLSGKGKGISYEGRLNVYTARVEDWILWKPTRFRYWEAENIALVLSRGMDLRLGSGFRSGEWAFSMKASYALTRTTREGDEAKRMGLAGRQLIYIPVHAANAYLNISNRGYFLNWTLGYTGFRHTQPAAGDGMYMKDLDPYTLHDLHLGKTWKIREFRAGFQFTVCNLLDVSYQAVRSRPTPGRNFSLTLNIAL
jgi:iron complex outermembrane receptor protein